MFPLDISYLRPSLGDANRLYWRYRDYIAKVSAIETADNILYHQMAEAAGGVAVDTSPEGNDGAYTGVTLGETGVITGNTCPLFDGTNDFNNIYSAGFNSDFDGKEGTIAIWVKVNGVGVWTDGILRRIINIYVDANNEVLLWKPAANNTLEFRYKAGGTSKTAAIAGHSETDWIHIALTWSKTGDELKYYEDGSQVGATLTGLGTWAGNISASWCCIGANNTTPSVLWYGWLDHALIWKKALTPAQILALATI